MATQPEDEQLKLEGEKPKEKTPEDVATAATQKAKENEAVAVLANAERGGEAEAPVAESAEKDMEARVREIAQKYLETIPKGDHKLTDPKQVGKILDMLTNTVDPRDDVFRPADKYGNPPDRVGDAMYNKDIKKAIEGWREFAADPVGLAKETNKMQGTANSTLPESVRSAILSIILKEGDYSAVDMANDIAEMLEKSGEVDGDELYKKYSTSPEASQDHVLRQKAMRGLFKGLYPDLMQSEEVALLLEARTAAYQEKKDRNTAMTMLEQYNQLVGGDAPFSKQFGDIQNGAELLAKLKDGSIPDRSDDDIGVANVVSLLQKELKKVIAQKATSAEAK